MLGIGDDAAILGVAPGSVLESAAATLVGEDTDDPVGCAKTLLARCEQTLRTRGVTGRWMTLALTAPAVDPAWLGQFAVALDRLAADRDIALVGGDTTAGPRCLSLVLHGLAAQDANPW